MPIVENDFIPVKFHSSSLGFHESGQTTVIFQVAETEPSGPVIVGETTEVIFNARKQ